MNDSLDQALSGLPHGAEFRFVDTVTAMEPGRSGTGWFRVRAGWEFLRGHFPGGPVLPGVILVEAIAQLGGVVAQSDPSIPPLPGLRLTAIRAAKIVGTAAPGEVVDLEVTVTGRMGVLVQVTGTARTGGRELARCDVVLSGTTG